MMNDIGFSLAIGILLDFLLGDPAWMSHPVIWIGKLISFLEGKLRALLPDSPKGKRVAGTVLVITVCLVVTVLSSCLVVVAFTIHRVVGICVMGFMCYRMLAAKSLRDESMRVYGALVSGSLEDSRRAVSRIVGRDTGSLSEEGVTKAAVETVAENFSDGVAAPMFYMMIGGPGLMYLYKAVNTMDSMVGYKNATYIDFGRAAAKFDDLVNYIPARLAAWALILAAFVLRMNGKGAYRIWRRDRKNHASPNAAQTESAAAGALGVQLAGNAYYFGELYEKPTIGDATREIEPEDIRRVNRLMIGGTVVMGLFCILISLLIGILV